MPTVSSPISALCGPTPHLPLGLSLPVCLLGIDRRAGGGYGAGAIARALSAEPENLLAALTREQLNVEPHRIWRETGTTALVVTDSIAEPLYLAHRVVVMMPRPGRMQELLAWICQPNVTPPRRWAAHRSRRLHVASVACLVSPVTRTKAQQR